MFKTIFTVIAATLLLATPSQADDVDRAVEGALGGAAGGLIFGPVGLVVGAVTGYTAGPAISHSWGLDRQQSRGAARRPKNRSSAQKIN